MDWTNPSTWWGTDAAATPADTSPPVISDTSGNAPWYSADSLTKALGGVANVYNSVTQTNSNAAIARANNDFSVYSAKAGIDIQKAILQGQMNNAQRQSSAAYQSGQSAFGNAAGALGMSPMVLLILGFGAFLLLKK